MSTLIVYMTKHGATEKNLTFLKSHLKDQNIETCNLKKAKCNPEKYDNIIIGGSIHAGGIQGKIKKFCQKYEDLLLSKKLGIFITCMEEGEEAREYFSKNFPEKLLKHAHSTALFGGKFDFEKMNFVEKAIVKKITGFDKTISHIDEGKVAEFAKEFTA